MTDVRRVPADDFSVNLKKEADAATSGSIIESASDDGGIIGRDISVRRIVPFVDICPSERKVLGIEDMDDDLIGAIIAAPYGVGQSES